MSRKFDKARELLNRAKQVARDHEAEVRAAHNAPKLSREEREAEAMAGRFHVGYPNERAGRDHLAKLRAQAQAELDAVVAEARGLVAAQADEARARLAKTEPSGVEAVAARMEAADARARVRALLDQGRRPKQILDQAVELGDRRMIAALRDEEQWRSPARFDPRPYQDAELSLATGAEAEAMSELLQAERHGAALDYELGTIGLNANAGLHSAIETKRRWADAERQFTLPDDEADDAGTSDAA